MTLFEKQGNVETKDYFFVLTIIVNSYKEWYVWTIIIATGTLKSVFERSMPLSTLCNVVNIALCDILHYNSVTLKKGYCVYKYDVRNSVSDGHQNHNYIYLLHV
jgi:hypothetical protein